MTGILILRGNITIRSQNNNIFVYTIQLNVGANLFIECNHFPRNDIKTQFSEKLGETCVI